MSIDNPNKTRRSTDMKDGAKKTLVRAGMWKPYVDPFSGIPSIDIFHRMIPAEYHPDGIRVIAWVYRERYAVGANGGPGYEVIKWCEVPGGDERVLPKKDQWLPVPEGRADDGVKAVWWVEKRYQRHMANGEVMPIPHHPHTAWGNGPAHPDDVTSAPSSKKWEPTREFQEGVNPYA